MSDEYVVVVFEFEPADGEEDAWDYWYCEHLVQYISAEENLLPTMVKKTITEGTRRIIDTNRVRERELCQSISAFLGRDHCSSDAEWSGIREYVSFIGQQMARITRITLLGSVSESVARKFWDVAQLYGFAQPGVLRELRPPWLVRLIHSGESVACLSLTASTAADATAAHVGKQISYTPRSFVGERLVPLTQPFEYHIEAVFGGPHGGAVALRPAHDPRALFVAFRGVRTALGAGRRADCKALLETQLLERGAPGAEWLPAGKAHAGVLRYHRSLWDLSALPTFLEKARCEQLLFLGISLGGAIAQMTALRAVQQMPAGWAAQCGLNVLGFGAVTWADHALSKEFESALGSRAANLTSFSHQHHTSPGPPVSWEVPSHAGSAVLLDPMACGFSEELCALHNNIPLCIDSDTHLQHMCELTLDEKGADDASPSFLRSDSSLAEVHSDSAAVRGVLQAPHVKPHVAPSTFTSYWRKVKDMEPSQSQSVERTRELMYAAGGDADVARFAADVAQLHTGSSYRSMAINAHLKLRLASTIMATPAGEPSATPVDADRLPFAMRTSPESLLDFGEGVCEIDVTGSYPGKFLGHKSL